MSVHSTYFDLATPLVDLDLQREGALLSGGGVCQAPLGQLVLAPAVVWDSTQPTRLSGGETSPGGSDASCRQITVDICCRYVDSRVLREQLGPTTPCHLSISRVCRCCLAEHTLRV